MAHPLLDDGMDFCVPCDQLVRAGRFCGRCGGSLIGGPEPASGRPVRRCPDDRCGHETRSTFCEACGARVVPLQIERIEQGKTTLIEMMKETMARFRAWQAKHPQAAESPADAERRRLYNVDRRKAP